MKSFNFKKLMPHLAAVGIFIAMSLAYFNPLLEGKKLHQEDTVRYLGMSKEVKDFRENKGEEALWTNSMFSGMPAYQISVKYKTNLMKYVDRFLKFGLPHPASLMFLALLSFYILLITMRVNPWLSIAGAFAFGLTTYFLLVIEAGHNSKAHAMAYMPAVLAAILLTFRGKLLWGGLLMALFFGLELNAGHPQITYYLGMVVLIIGIGKFYLAIRGKYLIPFFKQVGVLTAAMVLAFGMNITSFWATYEYGKATIRGESELTIGDQSIQTSGLDVDYITRWSYGINETFNLFVPDLMGGASQGALDKDSETYKTLQQYGVSGAERIISGLPVYWGDQPFTTGPSYVGAIVFFLFILGMFIVRHPIRWWLLIAVIISIMLSWGKNFIEFTWLFLDYFPMYNKFRAVTMILVITQLAIPLLGFLALRNIFLAKVSKDEVVKGLKWSVGIAGGLALIFTLAPGAIFDFTGLGDSQFLDQLRRAKWPDAMVQDFYNALQDDRKSILREDAFRSLIFVLLAAGLVWSLATEKLKKNTGIAILALLIVFDMWGVGRRYLNNDDFVSKRKMEVPYQPTRADQQILADKDPNFRVYNLTVSTFNDASTSYFHKSIGGYHGAKLQRYQELIEHHIGQRNMDVLNMLNTKYFIVPDQQTGQPVAQRNPGALGNAWFVDEIKLVANADSEITALNDFNPAKTVVIDQRFEEYLQGFDPNTDPSASIHLEQYEPNHLVYKSNATSEQFAVFSEIYYQPGWNAYIDGKPAEHVRVNYVLRGMKIPAGEHKIEFKFEPKVYAMGEGIALGSSVLLVVFAIFVFVKRKNEILE